MSSGKQSSGGGAIPTLKTGRAHPHPEPLSGASYSAMELMPGERTVVLLDQRLLPRVERYEFVSSAAQVAEAIRGMMVRGAPALGITAAYGLVLAASGERGDEARFRATMDAADETLRRTRPTARNLGWALDRMRGVASSVASSSYAERVARLADEARAIHREDVAACRKIGALGASLIPDGATILTHCNAGALATGGYGTALGVVRAAREAGKKVRVIADETRPLLQGARLTAWELARDGIPVEVITDGMAASLFAKGQIHVVVVGADRIAKNGDVANKIGTYGVACLAQLHGVPFDVAAPMSTVDLECPTGDAIPIEQRPESEVTHFPTAEADVQVVPEGVRVRNPAFDVTPARLVRAIHTEKGSASPNEASLAGLSGRP
jgi:methylthioribose-1-phosphate isomerase